jgi:predicted transcriptional regulator
MTDAEIKGRALKILRLRAFLSPTRAAGAAGVSLRSLAYYESGKPVAEDKLTAMLESYGASLLDYERECVAVMRASEDGMGDTP